MSNDVLHDRETTGPPRSFRAFVILWFGEFVSLTGSQLSGFALGVYVYVKSDSVTSLGLLYALPIIPFMLASPIAGSLVDRWGVRRTLLVSNIANMLNTLVLAVLLLTNTFEVWHAYLIIGFASTVKALQLPAFEASVPLLVPREHLGRANGMRMFVTGISAVMGPILGGVLLIAIDIYGVVLLDVVSFGLALITLLLVKVPHPRPEEHAGGDGKSRGLIAEFRETVRYVRAKPGLVALMWLLAVVSFAIGFAELLLPPVVLAFAPSDSLGTVLSFGSIGMIATSLLMSVWGGPRRRVRGAVWWSLLFGVALVIGSLRPSVALITVAAFIFLGSTSIIIGSIQTIWQAKVKPSMLGRTAALKNTIIVIPQIIANITAGLFADYIFEPFVGRDEVRFPAVATVVGDGPGRGFALLMMVVGIFTVVMVGLAYLNPRLRHLEQELPDELPEEIEPEPVSATSAAAHS